MVSKICCSTPTFLFLMSIAVLNPLFPLGFLPLFYISIPLIKQVLKYYCTLTARHQVQMNRWDIKIIYRFWKLVVIMLFKLDKNYLNSMARIEGKRISEVGKQNMTRNCKKKFNIKNYFYYEKLAQLGWSSGHPMCTFFALWAISLASFFSVG
jgi:hypothetical protein